MTWAVASVLALILTGLPLVVLPSASFAMFAVPTAALCAGGIAARSVPLLTAGATLAVIEYAVALWVSDGRVNIWMAAAFGVALFVLLELVDFMSKIHGAAVLGAAVMTSLIRYWLAIAAAGVGLMVVLLAGAAAVQFTVPLPSDLAAAAAGALGTFVAAVGVLKLVATSRDEPPDRYAGGTQGTSFRDVP